MTRACLALLIVVSAGLVALGHGHEPGKPVATEDRTTAQPNNNNKGSELHVQEVEEETGHGKTQKEQQEEEDPYVGSAVMHLDHKSFDAEIRRFDSILVNFHSPACVHCTKLAPQFIGAAEELQAHQPPLPLAEVNAVQNRVLASRLGVRHYPTLYLFRNGELSPYTGERSQEGIVTWMKRNHGPASFQANSLEALDMYRQEYVPRLKVVLGLFSRANHKEHFWFVEVANKLRSKYAFVHSSSKEIREHWGVEGEGVVLMQPAALASAEEREAILPMVTSAESLVAWLQANDAPLVGVYDARTSDSYDNADLPLALLWGEFEQFRSEADEHTSHRIMEKLRKIARANQDLRFAVIDIRVGMGSGAMSDFGLAPSDQHAVTVRDIDGTKYVFRGLAGQKAQDLDLAPLTEWIGQFQRAELAPFVRSEEDPGESVDGIWKLTAANIQQKMLDTKHPMAINVCNSHHHPCRMFRPTWVELASELAKQEGLVFYEFDTAMNDSPPFLEIDGFPTILVETPHDGTHVFDGDTDSADDIKGFLRFHAHRAPKDEL